VKQLVKLEERVVNSTDATLHAVTGAYGYSGKYIAQRLLGAGHAVMTLTNSLSRRNPFGDRVKPFPFHFDRPELLTEQLRGVSVLYNTYWVRFNHRLFKHADAVRNTLLLFEAAKKAGVQRIVHVSITNPSEASPLEYFRGKAVLEKALMASGVSYAILRPAVLFGKEDILINNIAWALRRLPVFGVFGDGQYRLQPIHVDDLACLAVEQGKRRENILINAIGPESFTYRELVAKIGQLIGKQRPIISVGPWFGYAVGWFLGSLVGDVVITKEEIEGLMADLLYVDAPPAGHTVLSDWIRTHAEILGRSYTSELARRKDQVSAYRSN
jgi:NADH dehydrogenase